MNIRRYHWVVYPIVADSSPYPLKLYRILQYRIIAFHEKEKWSKSYYFAILWFVQLTDTDLEVSK